MLHRKQNQEDKTEVDELTLNKDVVEPILDCKTNDDQENSVITNIFLMNINTALLFPCSIARTEPPIYLMNQSQFHPSFN